MYHMLDIFYEHSGNKLDHLRSHSQDELCPRYSNIM